MNHPRLETILAARHLAPTEDALALIAEEFIERALTPKSFALREGAALRIEVVENHTTQCQEFTVKHEGPFLNEVLAHGVAGRPCTTAVAFTQQLLTVARMVVATYEGKKDSECPPYVSPARAAVAKVDAAECETHTYTVVDNRYQGEGSAWVITDLPYGERWKYGLHGDFTDKVAADLAASKLNRAWGVEEN